jgi:integrase
MSVYQHSKSPYWHFDFQVDGYRFAGSTGVKKERSRREAEAFEKGERRKAEQLCEEMRRSEREPLKLKSAADQWWQLVGKRKKETDLEKALHWLVAQVGPTRYVHEINNDDILRAIEARQTSLVPAGRDNDGRRLFRPVSARTVNRTVVLLMRRVMRWSFKVKKATVLNWPDWKDLLLPEPDRPPTPELSIAEEDRLAQAGRPDYADLREFAIITGLRRNETLLTWPQVDFDNALVRLIAKGGKPRIVPLSRRAYEILWAQRGRHPVHVFTYVAERTRTEPRSGKRIIRGERYPITPEGLKSIQGRLFKKAGVDKRWHDLRHTAGMRTLRATGNLKLTQKLLGHAKITTTADYYADALIEDLRAGMESTAADVESRRESQTKRGTDAKSLNSR